MVFPPINWFQGVGIGIVDDLPDHFEVIDRFVGGTTADGQFFLGIKDGDSVKILVHTTDIQDTQLRSVHLSDDSTSYQNNSGKDAFAIIKLTARDSGTGSRAFKIYSSPNDNSKTSATEVYDFDGNTGFNNTSEDWTTPPLKIQNTHFCVVECLSGNALRDIDVSVQSRVVERV